MSVLNITDSYKKTYEQIIKKMMEYLFKTQIFKRYFMLDFK